MDAVEKKQGKKFDYLISHHAFTNAMTGAQILDRRRAEGNTKLKLLVTVRQPPAGGLRT